MVILPLSIVGGHMTVQASNAEEDIHRLNYGVLFQKQPSLYLSREYWLHTFEVELPSNISIQSIPSCTSAVSTCYLFNSIIFHVNVLKENTMTFTHRTLMEIFDMVPETDLNLQKRKSRALLPFIGSLIKSFFGTATMDYVNLLANHINKLVKRDRQMSHALEQHGSHISSFMKVVNHRFDMLKEGMQLNHELINQLLSSGKNFEILMTNMSMVAFKQISKANEIQVQLVNTLSSIQSRINGKITPHLIPEHVLKKTINGIFNILQKDYPQFHLFQNKPSMYYQNAKFFFKRHHSRLYITMKFPISSFSSALTLYKILSFPHPISQKNITKATHILDLPNYIAITTNRRNFKTFNYETLYNCDVERFLPELTKPNIFELSPASILLTNAKEKIAKSAKKDEIIFQNLAESLLDGQITLDSNWPDTNGYIGIASITIGGISFIVCLFKHKSHNTTIMLEITSGGSRATIPVTSFPLCPSYWDIQPQVTIQNVQICNFPFGKLSVEWPGFKVINKLTKQSLIVKTCFKVGLFNYFKARRIINQPYCAYILIVHQGLATPLQENQEPSIPKITQYHEFQNNLYPNLEPYL
ncbi:unnamed protein product [Mytilus coruscus]|uniref:Uncharacterized protein n=1 Tax=Mytilus coruscus TaxID=42192 RepID=A0A6J8A7W0_MYTCO|nr:unnamed protein product [Mytilus coruscus]